MNQNILLLDLPNFIPKYEEGIYYSYKGKGGENLKKLLTNTSNGYCMYCFSKILIDKKNFGELEHSIEKFNSKYKLVNCPSNMAIACPTCNRSFKKKGEKDRKLSEEEIKEFESLECKSDCKESCSAYKKLRRIVKNKNEGEIILQPFGIKDEITQNEYSTQYDVLNQKFIPSLKYNYNEEEKTFINKHINRFNLNDSDYRTKEISIFCKDVVDYRTIPKKGRYSNFIVDLFIEKLVELKIDEAIQLCNLVYNYSVIKCKS